MITLFYIENHVISITFIQLCNIRSIRLHVLPITTYSVSHLNNKVDSLWIVEVRIHIHEE